MFINYYFVASTLPIKYINENHKNKKTLIIIKNQNIYKSYEYLEKLNKNIKIKLLNEYLFFRIFELIIYFLFFKLKNKKFYFFHECCWPDFDLIIKIFNPISCHIPIVTMNGFKKLKKINKITHSNQKIKILFCKLFLENFFIIYFRKVDLNYSLFYTFKNYPNNVQTKKYKQAKQKPKVLNKNILFLVSREFCDNSEIINLYKKISYLFEIKGFKIYYKDHPNKNSRLNYNFSKLKKINPNKPFELIKKNFDYLIGCGSTPLAYKGEKSICVIKMVKSYKKTNAKFRINHMKTIYNGKKIFFPTKMSELSDKINKIR
tara:strand:- start:666 stop:1619 length:954 start_codon:yes stop_codon:yes gene_type:complete